MTENMCDRCWKTGKTYPHTHNTTICYKCVKDIALEDNS